MKTRFVSRGVVLAFGALLFLPPLAGCSPQTNKAVAHDIKTTTSDAATSAGTAITDSSITTAVKAKILVTKGLDSLDIHVLTRNGVVYLTGMVEQASQIPLAGAVAWEASGVKGVVNNLKAF